MSYTLNSWANKIMSYATEHWGEDGMDIVVEAYTIQEVATLIDGCESYEEALQYIKTYVKSIRAYENEIRAAGF